MERTVHNKTVTGRDYVSAIRELLLRAGVNSVSFDPCTCNPDRDIPALDWGFCHDDRLSCVWLPESVLEKPTDKERQGIGLTGTLDYIQPGVFTGDEKHGDFEAIFHAVKKKLTGRFPYRTPTPSEAVEKLIRPKWNIVFEEERYGTDPYTDFGTNGTFGIISDGRRFLFFRTEPIPDTDSQRCKVFHDILMTDDTLVCQYLLTAENDSRLINALNDLDDPNDYCGDGSFIEHLDFSDKEDK